MEYLSLVTYNVLADPFANIEHYPRNNPIDLDPTVRQARLMQELDKYIRQRFVITLQEVSKGQVQWLEPLFQSQGYFSHWFSKGFSRDNYQGLLIAYPKHFRLVEIDYIHIQDNITFQSIEKRPPRSPALIVYLQYKQMRFWLGTIHLPANPKLVEIRAKYIAHVMSRMQEHGKRTNCKNLIITGDFNQNPTALINNDSWHDVSGNEKPTIVTWTVRQTEPESTRIDTIIASPGVSFVSGSVETIDKGHFLPNAQHSSDHIPVMVKLKLDTTTRK